MSQLPESIPQGCEARFVGEGAANVVFELLLPPDSSSSIAFQGRQRHQLLKQQKLADM
jgi:hypothetical protein